MRKLLPFVAKSSAPANVKVIDILHHTSSLTRLHPQKNKSHALVCKWMEHILTRSGDTNYLREIPTKTLDKDLHDIQLADSPKHHELDYIVRSEKQAIRAKKNEVRLLIAYQRWLKRRERILVTTKYGQLQCDAFEMKRQNLIEAKSSIKREHIRMAVGQLLDYSWQIEKKFGKANLGILLPRKPRPNSVGWLRRWKIYLVWRDMATFRDNANGQFT